MDLAERMPDAMILIYPAIGTLPDGYQKSLFEQLASPVPVQQCVGSMEIFYSAVKLGKVSGGALTQAAIVAGNLGSIVAQWSLYGKGLRGAQILAAMLRATNDPDQQPGTDPDVEYDSPALVPPQPVLPSAADHATAGSDNTTATVTGTNPWTPIYDMVAMLKAIQTFSVAYAAKLPTSVPADSGLQGDAQDAFNDAATDTSPPMLITRVADALYAYQGTITDADAQAAARTLCAQCAMFGAMNSFDVMGKVVQGVPRGTGIQMAMQRELGETPPAGVTWPEPANDPLIDQKFRAQPAPFVAPPQTPGT